MIYIVMFLVIVLDGIITYLIPSYFNNLNYFYPMLTITLITSIYGYYKKYLKLSLIMGFIYDLLYSNIFLYNTFIFLILAKVNKKVFSIFQSSIILKLVLLVVNIIIYDTINFLVIYFTKYNLVSLNDLFYKISHSLFLNIMSLFVLSFILKKITLKHNL